MSQVVLMGEVLSQVGLIGELLSPFRYHGRELLSQLGLIGQVLSQVALIREVMSQVDLIEKLVESWKRASVPGRYISFCPRVGIVGESFCPMWVSWGGHVPGRSHRRASSKLGIMKESFWVGPMGELLSQEASGSMGELFFYEGIMEDLLSPEGLIK